jgi:hypothetical protein
MSTNLHLIIDGRSANLLQTSSEDTYRILGGHSPVHKYQKNKFDAVVYRYIVWLTEQAKQYDWEFYALFTNLESLKPLVDAKEAHFSGW